MNIQYFKSAWGDIKNSPGWFGKLCLLTLLNFVPIFGQIVTLGYLYGWAREISWGTHQPMPSKIFANEDGKFWRRGWFVLVLAFVFSLVPYFIIQLGNYFQVMGVVDVRVPGPRMSGNLGLGILGNIVAIVGFLGMLLVSVLTWIGSMRVSIYDRLSAGFQLGKIWKMLRHDTKGMAKIFGMNVLFGVITGIVLSFIIGILMVVVVLAGVSGMVGAGYSAQSFQYMTETQAIIFLTQLLTSSGIVGLLALLVGSFAVMVAPVFVQMLVTRAVGYWTMQFEVPKWRGQDEPLPFEAVASASVSQQPQRPPVYAVPAQPFAQQPAPEASQWQSNPAATQAGAAPAQQPPADAAPAQPPMQQSAAFGAQPLDASAPVQQPLDASASVQPAAQDAQQPAAQDAQQLSFGEASAPQAAFNQPPATEVTGPMDAPAQEQQPIEQPVAQDVAALPNEVSEVIEPQEVGAQNHDETPASQPRFPEMPADLSGTRPNSESGE